MDSDEPLTSGEEEEEPEEELDARQWFRLLSLEERTVLAAMTVSPHRL